ncbi:unnamed protein product [Schistosoma curassoni]|uniref:DUF6451 domain-containing protein n=1 Tax=Schistosoma curassoni TaxID=6186 RepID=A0A183K7K7_9TREM|nr:unnamed protein product [Schistosoma curassoni]
MKTSTSERKHGIQWTDRMQLDDPDFADDLAFLSQSQQQLQEKTQQHIIDEHGGCNADVKAWIGKARAAYLQLKNIWNSRQLSTNTKVRILNTNIKTVLLYGAETWRTTKAIIQKIQVFINSCLPKILRIRWPDTQQQPTMVENKPDPSGGSARKGWDTY